jgi:hypothetical protein
MEPKSIAFFAAVAVSILAVISATTLPTIAHAITESEGGTGTNAAQQESNTAAVNDNESTGNNPTDEEEEEGQEAVANAQPTEENTDSMSEGAAAEDDTAGQSLSLAPSTSVLSCGETIDQSVTLNTDMVCPEGFTIAGEGVVFNLNGHTLSSGVAEDSPASQLGSAGITVANAVDAKIIGLGVVEGFGAGVRILASEGTQVQEMQVTGNDVGIDMIGATGADISRNSITNNDIGVRAVQSSDIVVAFDQIVANVYRGISFEGVSGASVIAANSLFGNGEGEEGGSGIYLDPNTEGVNTDYNSAWANGPYDINHADGLSTSVTGNTFGPNNNCGTSVPAGLCNGQTAEI